jgi:hypothetical protein
MPSLTWASKSLSPIPEAALEMDSIVYPLGSGYPGASPENQLILGDNLSVMAALLPDIEGHLYNSVSPNNNSFEK